MNKKTREELEQQSSTLTDAFMTCFSKVEELEAQVKQLAAENAALKTAAEKCYEEIQSIHSTDGWSVSEDGESDTAVISLDGAKLVIEDLLLNIETPATDAYAASLRAEGVEMFANDISGKAMKSERGSTAFALLLAQAEYAKEFADQLRSKSEVQS